MAGNHLCETSPYSWWEQKFEWSLLRYSGGQHGEGINSRGVPLGPFFFRDRSTTRISLSRIPLGPVIGATARISSKDT